MARADPGPAGPAAGRHDAVAGVAVRGDDHRGAAARGAHAAWRARARRRRAAIAVLAKDWPSRRSVLARRRLDGWCRVRPGRARPEPDGDRPGLPNDHYHAFLDPALIVHRRGRASRALATSRSTRSSPERARRRCRAVAASLAASSCFVAIAIGAWPSHRSPDGSWPLADAGRCHDRVRSHDGEPIRARQPARGEVAGRDPLPARAPGTTPPGPAVDRGDDRRSSSSATRCSRRSWTRRAAVGAGRLAERGPLSTSARRWKADPPGDHDLGAELSGGSPARDHRAGRSTRAGALMRERRPLQTGVRCPRDPDVEGRPSRALVEAGYGRPGVRAGGLAAGRGAP